MSRHPATYTIANAHHWTPAMLRAREQQLRRAELGSKYAGRARTEEIRRVRVALARLAAPAHE